jgi:hypothetical protein
MHRREAIIRTLGLSALLGVVPLQATRKFGFISVDTHPRARVWLDGIDISSRCYAADDVRGFADCFAVDAQGRKYQVGGTVARERLYGQVVIEARDPIEG